MTTNRESRYEYVCYLVETKLNGTKYFNACYIPALISILHSVFKIDTANTAEMKAALASAKEALQIYFGIYQQTELAVPFPEKRERFEALSMDDIIISEWHGKKEFKYKEGSEFSGILFHFSIPPDEEDYEDTE